MENRRLLIHRIIANPMLAAVNFGIAGALVGFLLHVETIHSARQEEIERNSYFDLNEAASKHTIPNLKYKDRVSHENATPFVIGFAFTGAVIGLTSSYCSYIHRRLKQRSLRHGDPGDAFGIVGHGALAGAFLLGGSSLVLSITELPFLSGEPTGTEFWVFTVHGLFNLGDGLLLGLVGISQAMISEMQHSNDTLQFLLGLLSLPLASAVFGALCGSLVTGLIILFR